MNTNILIKKLHALMGKMNDKDVRDIVESLEDAIDYLQEKPTLTSEQQLRYVVREYLEYYNHERPHSGLGGRMIAPAPQPKTGRIVKRSRLGGLLNTYIRVPNAA